MDKEEKLKMLYRSRELLYEDFENLRVEYFDFKKWAGGRNGCYIRCVRDNYKYNLEKIKSDLNFLDSEIACLE